MINLLQEKPNSWVYTNTLNQEVISKYNLTLSKYTVFQLVTIMNNKDHSEELGAYLNQHAHEFEENMDFRNGVNDAFCEIVRAGVKKLALSHATDDEEIFSKEFHSAYQCVKKYNIKMYVEEDLIETLLFDISGCKVIIFYSEEKDIEDYIALKHAIRHNNNPTLEDKKGYARELGRLLSYSSQRIEDMIASNIK